MDKKSLSLKGKSTLMIYDRHPELQNKWNKAFWARGYYVATIGNLTEEAIKKYVAEQSEVIKGPLGGLWHPHLKWGWWLAVSNGPSSRKEMNFHESRISV